MTNDEIIYNEVNAKYHTPEQRRAILALAYTPEQIAAKGKEIHFKGVPEEQQGEELEKAAACRPVPHVPGVEEGREERQDRREGHNLHEVVEV